MMPKADGVTWPTAPLNRLVRIVGGGTPSKTRADFWQGAIPWVSPKDMLDRELRDAADHITETAVEQSATQIVPPGSVLVVVRSGILAHRFPVSLTRTAVALNQDMKALLPGGPLIPEFLAYALEAKSDYVLRHCVKRGATVHSVDMGRFQQVCVPVPPPPEQRRIVEILDQADRLRRLRAETEVKADRILPALFVETFGDPQRLTTHHSAGPLSTFDVDLQNGFACSEKDFPNGVPHLRMNNISGSGRLDLSRVRTVPSERDVKRYRLQAGDVLFMSTNGEDKIGKACIFALDGPASYLFNNHLIRIRLRGRALFPEYLATYLQLL